MYVMSFEKGNYSVKKTLYFKVVVHPVLARFPNSFKKVSPRYCMTPKTNHGEEQSGQRIECEL
jgi:hypothetical protein